MHAILTERSWLHKSTITTDGNYLKNFVSRSWNNDKKEKENKKNVSDSLWFCVLIIPPEVSTLSSLAAISREKVESC